jgi:uncharacterized protein YndB with AHSA1/START domain
VQRVPDITRSITVPAPPEQAFRVYTECAAEWLPPAHAFIPGAAFMAMEPRAGGRFFERGADGTEVTRGTIVEWAPPRRLAVTWRVGPGWRPARDDEHASVIEVEFTPAGRDRTEVTLTYTHLDRHGEMASVIRSAIEGANPGETLQNYADAVARLNGPPA